MTLFENNSSSWSISSSFDQFDWNDTFFGKDLLLPDPIELIPEDQTLRSIHWDCKQIESSSGTVSPTTDMSSEFLDFDDFSKYEIRNHDCMWSGLCINNSTNKKQNLQQQQQQRQQKQINNDELQRKCHIKEEILISNNINTEALVFKNIQNQENSINIKQQTLTPQQHNVQSVPPGTSLLLNSRITQQQQQQMQRKKQQQQYHNQMLNFTIPNVTTIDFLKERESMPTARPDTPLSLDDDPPEFKHTVDLAACVMGSNNICLDTDPDKIINKLKEQLEDTTRSIDTRLLPGNKHRSLSEVLNVIENENSITGSSLSTIGTSTGVISASTVPMIKTKIEPDDDYDDDDDEENDDSELDDVEDIIPKSKLINGNNGGIMSSLSIAAKLSSSASSNEIAHDDHCYTRSNGAIDVVGMGLETPSDSDEEIDVVSIGDKKLPNNPSDRDRRVLQTKVANKISARIVKTVNGIRTIPPRRRCSYEPYTAPVTPVKGSNSRYPTPVATPLAYHQQQHNTNYHHHSLLTSSAGATTTVNNNNSSRYNTTSTTTNSRKRSAPSSNSSKDDHHHHTTTTTSTSSTKRHRSKKHKSSSRKHNYVMDEAETIEKRNLHNDMERQRRIGLKNLFEALKKHIPSIKDKERAPKVNILREAAKFCELLNREEKMLMAQKHQLQLQQQRRIAQVQILQMSTSMNIKEESIED